MDIYQFSRQPKNGCLCTLGESIDTGRKDTGSEIKVFLS